MIENIVRRAKKEAIKRFLSTGEKGIKSEDLLRRDPRRVQGERGPAEHHEPGRLGADLGQEGRADRLRPHAARATTATAGRSSASTPGSTCKVGPDGHPQGLRHRDRVRHRGGRAARLQPGPVVIDPDLARTPARSAASAGTTSRSRRCATRAGSSPCQAREPVDEDLGLANVILPNGARYYVDHAHPEYSTPECLTPRDARRARQGGGADPRAVAGGGRSAMLPAGPAARRSTRTTPTARATPTARTRTTWWTGATPFARHRPRPDAVLRHRGRSSRGAGQGRRRGAVGRARPRDRTSSRSARTSSRPRSGLETTLKRPIINTRDEPHADPEKYRRLHVIIGDANMCEVATFLKVGTTALVLKMIEDEFLPDLSLENPVPALHEVSRDITCTADGRAAPTAGGSRPCSCSGSTSSTRRSTWSARTTPPENREVAAALGGGARPRSRPSRCRCIASWTGWRSTACWTAYRERDGLDWRDPKLRADRPAVPRRPARPRACTTGSPPAGKVERLDDRRGGRAARSMEPPEDTRAYFRGRCISRYPDAIAAASWDSLIFDTGATPSSASRCASRCGARRSTSRTCCEASEDAAALVELAPVLSRFRAETAR